MTEKVKPIIKNIFWDVDGVLANLNFAYFNFLKNHKNYKYWVGRFTKSITNCPKIWSIRIKNSSRNGERNGLWFLS